MKLFLVRWRHDYFYYAKHDFGGFPVAPADHRLNRAFTNPIAAEEFRRKLERGYLAPPKEANPFHGLRGEFCFELGVKKLCDLTSMPAGVLADWLCEVGLEPPAPEAEGRAWADWYEFAAPTMTNPQRCRVWQALDKLHFFETIETELEA